MSDPAPKDTFDPTKPLVTTRGFMAGKRRFKPNEVFDLKALGCSVENAEDLYDTGYLRYGQPRPRLTKEERDARRMADAKAQDVVGQSFALKAAQNRARIAAEDDASDASDGTTKVVWP